MKMLGKIFPLLLVSVALALPTAGCSMFSGDSVGTVVAEDDWVYYIDRDNQAATLYKTQDELTDKIIVAENFDTGYMTVVDDAIYFFDVDASISKIKTDGSERTTLTSATKDSKDSVMSFEVADDWLYYATKSGSVYKMKTDGTGTTQIPNVKPDGTALQATKDWLYYTDANNLYKVKPDGSENEKVAENVSLFEAQDDWVIYGEQTDEDQYNELYLANSSDDEPQLLATGVFTAINDDWLYYQADGWLNRIKLDGSVTEKLTDEEMWGIFDIEGNYIYYGQYSGEAFRIDLDGGNKTPIK